MSTNFSHIHLSTPDHVERIFHQVQVHSTTNKSFKTVSHSTSTFYSGLWSTAGESSTAHCKLYSCNWNRRRIDPSICIRTCVLSTTHHAYIVPSAPIPPRTPLSKTFSGPLRSESKIQTRFLDNSNVTKFTVFLIMVAT